MTIEVNAADNAADGADTIADMFLARMQEGHDDGPSDVDETENDLEAPETEAAAEPQDDESEGEAEAEDEGTSEDGDDESTDEADEDDAGEPVTAEDDKSSTDDTRRLAGQEEALQRQVGETVEIKRKLEARLGEIEASLNHHYQMALEAYAPYQDQNFNILFANLDPETIETIKVQEKAARQKLEYFARDLATFNERQAQERKALTDQVIQANFDALRDPEHGIKGMSQELAQNLAGFAINDHGLTSNDLDDLIKHPNGAKFFKMMHRLHTLEQGQKNLQAKAKPVVAKQTRVIKSSPEAASIKADRNSSAMDRLRKDNSSENIQNAFLARMTRS